MKSHFYVLTFYMAYNHCSRLKPSYEFHFEGLSNFNASIEGLVQIQDVNPRIQNWNTKLILNLCMNYMVYVFSTMWRIKNQPSNFTSCNDNAPHLLVLVTSILYWGLQATSSFSIWGCVLKGCFERGLFWRATSRLKGIEDFNLEHCPPQHYSSWLLLLTLIWSCSLPQINVLIRVMSNAVIGEVFGHNQLTS